MSQSSKSNVFIIDSIFTKNLTEASKEIDSLSPKSINIKITEHASKNFVFNKIFNLLNSRDYKIDETSPNQLSINIYSCNLSYNTLSYSDIYLERKFIFDIELVLKKHSSIRVIKTYKSVLVDTLSIADAEYFNQNEFDFAKAKVPDKTLSFFQKYIEPIAITSAAILTVILFFTVRSN
jgi:hypothetical protein